MKRLTEMGASDVINYKTTPDWDKRVLELTDGAGVDHVVEVGGMGTLEKSLRAVRVGGRVSLTGFSARSGKNPMPVLFKSVCLQGIYVGSRDMFDEMDHAMGIERDPSGYRSHLPVRSDARSIKPSGKRGPFRQGLHPNLSGDESAIPDEVLCYGRGRAWCATLNSITQAWGRR